MKFLAIPKEEVVGYLEILNKIMDITLFGLNEGLFADPQFTTWYDSHIEAIIDMMADYVGSETAEEAITGYINSVVELATHNN